MNHSQMQIAESDFGPLPQGDSARLYSCRNARGSRLTLTNYGASIVALEVPDARGVFQNVVLGYQTLGGYLGDRAFLGSTVGRYANRISGGRFSLDGREYLLEKNEGDNHHHGGKESFARQIWIGKAVETHNAVGVRFARLSPDGEAGYPGNLHVEASFALTNENELQIRYRAMTDRATILNLTNHCYFNLAGTGTILDHEVSLRAHHYLPTDAAQIPTGKLAPVAGTPFDFRESHPLGARLAQLDNEPRGYDHCFALIEPDLTTPAAHVRDPQSGRTLELFTTEPGLQLYTGNFLGGLPEHGGYAQHSGLCLETQHFPDAPHQDHFPSTVLRPGEVFESQTRFRFGAS
jgi:aldose 1-epimerase